MNRLLVLLAVLMLGLPLSAKEPGVTRAGTKAAPLFVTITGNPLQINVGSDNSYQIFNLTLPELPGGGLAGQIYPQRNQQTADMGWFVRVGQDLYTANFQEHPGTPTAATIFNGARRFNEVSLSALSGDGSAANPYTVSVTVLLGTAGLRAVKTVTYVNGDNYFAERFRLVNISGSQVQATVYLGSDIFLANSDNGVPFREPTSGSPGGRTCAGVSPEYTILHIPLTPATRFTGSSFDSVWSQISTGTLNNTIATGCIDNGAALQWNVTVPAFGSRTVLSATSFGVVPAITQFNIIEVNPGQGVIGTTLDVTIEGYGFQPGTTFDFGPDIQVSNLVIVNANQARATLAIDSTADLGYRDVVATQAPGGIVATLADGFLVTEPAVWNFMVNSNDVSQDAFECMQDRFPGDPASNAEGWAPDEGAWSSENPPGFPGPPVGLARVILDCYMHPLVWSSDFGALFPRYCWLNPYPLYDGDYPHTRRAQLKLYDAVNEVCEGPQPGWPIYESSVGVLRQEFFPAPMARSGFEEP